MSLPEDYVLGSYYSCEMKYRRNHDPVPDSKWRTWIGQHRPALERLGLPLRVYEDAARWSDFLENGELHFHPDPGRFHFEQLSDGQLRQLRAFLEQEYGEYGAAEKVPPLLSWLRVRQGER